MTEPRPTSPAPPPPPLSLDALPPLPAWRPCPNPWVVPPPDAVTTARPSDLPTEDLAPPVALDGLWLPTIVDEVSDEVMDEVVDEGPTRDLGIPRASSPPTPSEDPPEPADDRRASRRHRLVGAAVRVAIHDPTGPVPTTRGRVRDISANGGLFVETRAPFPERTVVRVGMAVSSGSAMRLTGTVIRSTEEGMALVLRVDDEALAFLNVFVAVAREARTTGAMEVRIDRAIGDRTDPAEVILATAWHELKTAPSDPEAHGRLMDACVTAQRLDYALDRLRELKRAHPDVAEIDRSLEHCGRVIGFVAFARAPKVAVPAVRTRPFLVVAIVVVASVLALGGIARATSAPAARAPVTVPH